MFDWIGNLITNFEFNSSIALFMYWMPLLVCAVVYFLECINLYRRDVEMRDSSKHYEPELTVGLIVWYCLLTVMPVANLCAMVFDCASSVFSWLGKFLNIPLVPKRKTEG